jgi:hypothetical protein
MSKMGTIRGRLNDSPHSHRSSNEENNRIKYAMRISPAILWRVLRSGENILQKTMASGISHGKKIRGKNFRA